MKIISVKTLNKVAYVTFSTVTQSGIKSEITVCISGCTPIACVIKSECRAHLATPISKMKQLDIKHYSTIFATSIDTMSKLNLRHLSDFYKVYNLPSDEVPVQTNEAELRQMLRDE